MPDKKLTDNEIKKALEDFINHNGYCVDCPSIMKNALDLINRLQLDNEMLKTQNGLLVAEQKLNIKGISATALKHKKEAYKECIEKVKNKIRFLENRGFSIHYVVKDALNNLLKELVGEDGKSEDVKCKECEYLMFSDCYGECSKGYKGIVNPNDSCGKGKRKGEDK